MRTVRIENTDWEELHHIPLIITWDDSTLCGMMFDCWEDNWVISWEYATHNEITCSTCISILAKYKSLTPYLKLLK